MSETSFGMRTVVMLFTAPINCEHLHNFKLNRESQKTVPLSEIVVFPLVTGTPAADNLSFCPVAEYHSALVTLCP